MSETVSVDCLSKSSINCLYIPKLSIMDLYKIGLKVKTDEITFLICDELSRPDVVKFYGRRYEAGMYISVYLTNGIKLQDIKNTLESHFNTESRFNAKSNKLANLDFWHAP